MKIHGGVALVPCRKVSPQTVLTLARTITDFTGLVVGVHDAWELPPEAYDGMRRQFHAGQVLEAAQSLAPEALRVVAVVGKDLYLPIFTHVYGEAHLSGRTAVVSLYRLELPEDGVSPSRELFWDRAAKVVLHELLHTFGLTHCRHAGCLMQAVTSTPALDRLNRRLCRSCLNLWSAVRNDLKI
ncbi:archaemetzincin [Desulfacinum infernum DSM 9756]|uniref:Archaemetzincin n=1 Tax=Desulfacinum infernum DSM 9756 TaxID=1121391 RepID=A0A1M5CVQ7_9BACT|nr:archaemetzincin [Desulfacinum infernum]SHF58818.1 archaemetzincin [Desulfacinum infernum DSM 9756]